MVEAAGKDEQGGGVGAAVIIRGRGTSFGVRLVLFHMESSL